MDKAEDVMLDLAWRRFSEIWQDKRDIDSKASIILAADGVLIGLVANAKDIITPEVSTYALWGIICVFLSALFCVFALLPKRYKSFNVRRAWYDLEKYMNDLEQLKLEIYGAIATKSEYNTTMVFISGILLFIGTVLFLIGLFFITNIFIVLFLL